MYNHSQGIQKTENFAMLDEMMVANKEILLQNSSNMAATT